MIPQQDYQFLYDAGVKAIFGPGTNIPDAARDILKLIGYAYPMLWLGGYSEMALPVGKVGILSLINWSYENSSRGK